MPITVTDVDDTNIESATIQITGNYTNGQDLLVYTTPPLEEDIEVVGPITAKLYAATSARDTDWMVRLVDVHPDGHAALLCDGLEIAIRLSENLDILRTTSKTATLSTTRAENSRML